MLLLALAAELLYWATLLLVITSSPAHLRRTFYSTETGPAFLKRHLWTDKDEDTRASMLREVDYSLWQHYEDEVQDWLIKGWERWLQDQESWLNMDFVSGLPKHLVPPGLDAWSKANSASQDAASQLAAAGSSQLQPGRSSVIQAVKRVVTGQDQKDLPMVLPM